MSAAVDPVLFERDGAIARLTLNRTQAGNAVNLPLARRLAELATHCDQDDAIRCVVLTGAGRMFCAGGDLGEFAAAGDAVPEFLRELAGTLHEALATLARMHKPLLTVVNGPAAGAGLSLAISGDIVLSARSAYFSAAYGSVGLTPDGGMSWWLPRLVGLRRAQDIILGNRRISAEEAESIGLVTRTLDDAALAAEVTDYALRLSRSAIGVLGAARQLLLDGFSRGLVEQLDAEQESIARAGAAAECREGVAAFLGKRKPDFTAQS